MANEYVHAVDTEAYSYVFDWASLVALGHVDSVASMVCACLPCPRRPALAQEFRAYLL